MKGKVIIVFTVLVMAGCHGNGREKVYTGVIEGETYSVSAPFSEELQDVLVDEGDWVQKGDVLARMDTTSLQLQMKGLESKKDQLQAQLDELQIRRNQALDSSAYYFDTYSRFKDLGNQNAVSDQTVRDLKLQADNARYEAQVLNAKLDLLKSRQQELEYKVQELARSIERGNLQAPSDGFVDKIYFSTGEYIGALRPVMDITDLNEVWCTVYVNEETLMEIQPGGEARGILHDRTFEGRITHINSQAEFTPKEILTADNREALSYGVRVDLANEEKVLKIGMPINVVLRNND